MRRSFSARAGALARRSRRLRRRTAAMDRANLSMRAPLALRRDPDAGVMHNEANEVSLRIGDDVALASLDLLPGVIATRTAALRRLN